MEKILKTIHMIAGLFLSLHNQAQALAIPVAYTVPGSVYRQNFDGLPNTGSFILAGKGPFNLTGSPITAGNFTGWQLWMSNGSGQNANFGISTGSATGSGTYSYGATGNPERALGLLASGTGIYAIGIILTNQTGTTLNSFTVSGTAEQWRKGGSGNINTCLFRYKTGIIPNIDQDGLSEAASLALTSATTTTGAATLNGNLPENQRTVSHTITGISWRPGEQLLLRWDDSDEAGSDDALALDQFSFSASAVAGVPAISTVTISNITSNSAIMNAVINDNNAATTGIIEYDTNALLNNPVIITTSPPLVSAGAGATTVSNTLSALITGKTYFLRVKASNNNGTTTSPVLNFIIPALPPLITTLLPEDITNNSAVLGGSIRNNGGSVILEKGVAWSVSPNPTTSDNKLTITSDDDSFSQTITGLPQGTSLHIRAYASNTSGTSYGTDVLLTTKTLVTSMMPVNTGPANTAVANFTLKLMQPVTGLNIANFSLLQKDIGDASITGVSGSGSIYTITINTGTHDGSIGLQISNSDGVGPPVGNLPFSSTSDLYIDKSPPLIKQVSIPDTPMKIAAIVPVIIRTYPDTDTYKLVTGSIAEIPLSGFTKLDDSTYTANITIPDGRADIPAEADIPVSIKLKDVLGNNNATYTTAISQPSDLIDANKPYLLNVVAPIHRTYKTGDTLLFFLNYNEPVLIDTNTGVPELSLTIGSRIKRAAYAGGTGSAMLLFRYIIQPGENDNNGVKLNTPLVANGALLHDEAGNDALLSIPTAGVLGSVLIDAVAPLVSSVTVPPAATYKQGDILDFTVNYNEAIVVDISAGRPSITLNIGNVAKSAFYIAGSGSTSLLFRYVISNNELDKKTFSIGPALLLNGSVITDSAGNRVLPTLKNTGGLSGIKIDGIPLAFTKDSIAVVSICRNTKSISINEWLSVKDPEPSEIISWAIVSAPYHGTLTGFPATRNSNGNITLPIGLFYSTADAFERNDEFFIRVSDGSNNATIKILITAGEEISENTITGNQQVCAGSVPRILKGSIPIGGDGHYVYGWESSTVSSTDGFERTTNTDSLQDYSSLLLNRTTWFRRKVTSGSCSNISEPVAITVLKEGLWSGTNNNNWHIAGNWCGSKIPVSSTNVFIDQAAYNPVIAASAVCKDLVISSNASLTITGSLQVTGNISATGNIDARNGTMDFAGNAPQFVDSIFKNNQLNNMLLNNNNGVGVKSKLIITGTLVVNNGSLATNDLLTLAPGAFIGPSASGTTIIGNVALLHRFDGHKRTFHLLSHPFVTSKPLQMITGNIDITGTDDTTNDFISTGSNELSAFRFDPGDAPLPFDNNNAWIAFTSTNGMGENEWKKGQAIRLLISDNTTLRFNGMVSQGDQELILPHHNYKSYYLIGNPYPAPIDMSLVSASSAVGNYYWVWDNHQGFAGGYTSVPFKMHNLLPCFAGAFIKTNASANDHSLVFTENCKSATNNNRDMEDMYHIEMRLESDTIFWDRLLLFNLDSARDRFDKMDAEKMNNTDVNFYSLSADLISLSVDARPVSKTTIVPLGIRSSITGAFSIRITKKRFPVQLSLWLYDKYLKRSMPLEADSVYHFEITGDTATQGDQRFEIGGQRTVMPVTFPGQPFKVTIGPVPAPNNLTIHMTAPEYGNTQIKITTMEGFPVKNISMGLLKETNTSISVAGLASGLYSAEVICGKYRVMQKFIKL